MNKLITIIIIIRTISKIDKCYSNNLLSITLNINESMVRKLKLNTSKLITLYYQYTTIFLDWMIPIKWYVQIPINNSIKIVFIFSIYNNLLNFILNKNNELSHIIYKINIVPIFQFNPLKNSFLLVIKSLQIILKKKNF